VKKSESTKELAVSLAAVQGSIQDAKIDSKNPHFKSAYASLESNLQSARKLLSQNGLAVTQGVIHSDKEVILETTLLHKSGEFLTYEMPLILDKSNMQGLGSAITYARRYSLAALVGIGTEDDDGNKAIEGDNSGNQEPPQAPQSKPQATAKGVAPTCCGKKMMISKYNNSEYYCTQCKSKAPAVA
jgi:hypothetical protein